MRRRHFLGLTAILLAAGLAGCASPQILQPDPRRTTELPRTGDGQAVTVTTVDARDSEVIGTRSGSAMSTATITVPRDPLLPRLQAEAERAVREMGFTPTTERAEERPRLTLTLERLDYARGEGGVVLDEARLEAVLSAEAVNAGTTVTGTYTARRSQEYLLRPDKEANTRMINELLSDALGRAFRDPALARLLAR